MSGNIYSISTLQRDMPTPPNQEIENFFKQIFLGFHEIQKKNNPKENSAKKSLEKAVERFTQLYLFAEFGKMTSGLFHDLISPLTAILLQIEELKIHYNHPKKIQTLVDGAFESTKHLEIFLKNIRKQIQNQEEKQNFELAHEIQQAVSILSYRLKKNNIQVRLDVQTKSSVFGNAIRFHQIIINLLNNAIDAYAGLNGPRFIDISLKKPKNTWKLLISDYARGIPEKEKKYIFQPLFTTKESGTGISFGLCFVKYKIEKEFSGTIAIKNSKPRGTTFVVEFPCKKMQDTFTDS